MLLLVSYIDQVNSFFTSFAYHMSLTHSQYNCEKVKAVTLALGGHFNDILDYDATYNAVI